MLRAQVVVAALVGFAPLMARATAQETLARVPVAPDSRLWIEGTSNLHRWSCKADQFEAIIELNAKRAANIAATPVDALEHVDVKVPILALKCGHGAMDKNLYKALRASDAPEISYILARFDAVEGGVRDTFKLETVGRLAVAGRENRVEMEVAGSRLPDGTIHVTGVVPIRMTDYGIDPPTALFGRLKTGNEVQVHFELTVGPKAIAMALLGRD